MENPRRLTSREQVCELIAALMKAPRTERELHEMTDLVPDSVAAWCRSLKSSGLLLPAGMRKDPNNSGRPPALWQLASYPFEEHEPELAAPGRRIYLAGPMTGLPDFNYPAFNRAAKSLREAGWEVLNPAENPDPAEPVWREYMRMAVAQLVTCDTVALLPGWERSKGARIEWQLARGLGLRVVDAAELIGEVLGVAQ